VLTRWHERTLPERTVRTVVRDYAYEDRLYALKVRRAVIAGVLLGYLLFVVLQGLSG
jgi:hypothetical protein